MNSEPPDKHRSIKQALKQVVNDPASQERILGVVNATHRITVHVLHFLKLYLLNCYENLTPLPVVTEHLVVTIMNVICEESEHDGGDDVECKRGKVETKMLKQDLLAFHRAHYKPTMTDSNEKLGFTNMLQLLQYIAVDVVKDYENNIKLHFVQHLDRFLGVLYQKKERLAMKEDHKQLFLELRTASKYLLFQPVPKTKKARTEPALDEPEPPRLAEHLKHLAPQRAFKKSSVHYDLECSPQDYLPCLIYMMRWVEQQGTKIPNIFPLRTSIVPKYVRLDTKLVIQLLLPKDTDLGAPFKLLKDIVSNKDAVWRKVFKLDEKCFAPKETSTYQFGHTIQTDGVGCSILWVERSHHAAKMAKGAAKKERRVTKRVNEDHHQPAEKKDKKKEEMYVSATQSTKRVVGIDPGKSDLIYCSSGENKDDWFRYTQNQKRKETKEKKHRRKRSMLASNLIEGKSVPQWEAELSLLNRKVLTTEACKTYFEAKNLINSKLFGHYEQKVFRKLKFHAFVNRRRSEDRMVNRFREKFGTKEEVVLGWGDWGRESQMKFHEPTKGVGMRKLFRRAGFEVVLVDEFRTSCKCYGCQGGACEKFRMVVNPRSWKREERPMVVRNGLLRCQICKRLWNRDRNGSLNILRCAQLAMAGEPRPEYLKRGGTNFSDAISAGTALGKGLLTLVAMEG